MRDCQPPRAKRLALPVLRVYITPVSTTALHIVELVRSLSPADQKAVSEALSSTPTARGKLPPDSALDAADREGLPDDDPFFKVMEEIEQQRHAYSGRPAPALE